MEFLAPKDLEALRSNQTDSGSLLPRNKRYLILTCISEFDKVHYPLPMTEISEGSESPSPQVMIIFQQFLFTFSLTYQCMNCALGGSLFHANLILDICCLILDE